MPQFPQGDPRDRNIDPIVDEDTPPASDGTDPAAMQVKENDDGSADVTLPDDNPEQEVSFDENLAEYIDESFLTTTGADLIELVTRDKEARSRRDEQYEEGIKRTGLGNEAPGGATFSGASRAVHPMLAEACVDFASRAIKELFPPGGPVKTAIFGKEDQQKIDVANRKARYLNYQMTTKMREYRAELEQMLTQLPMGGSQYQKFWYDERAGRPRTEFVPIDDIFLPFAATDFYTASRKTHVQHITRVEFAARVKNGLYRDVIDIESSVDQPDQTASATASDHVEGRDADAYNDDGLRDVYEVYTYLELEQDDVTEGDAAPYIVTVDAYTEKVLAVYRNWHAHDKTFQALDWIVEWKFIPWRGAYAIGFPHLIGSLSGAATGALRALLDAAHINNAQSLVKLKGGRMSGQNLEIEPTEIKEIEGPAGTDDIRKILMPLPYNQPSDVLFQLLGWLTDAGKGVIATAEDALANAGDRTPVGTTMAMIEQGSQTYSAIHARLHYSQAKALEILCRINCTYMDDEETVEDLGGLVISKQEFRTSVDVIPVSDPNIFSEAQRFAQVQGAAQVIQLFPQEQWNTNTVARMMLQRLRLPNVDEILPEPPKPQNMNPAAENVAAMHGQPIVALPKQNHLAHIWAHIEFATSPIFANGMLGTQLMQQMVRHIGEHIAFYYADLMNQYTQFEQVVAQMPTKQLEDRMAKANTQVLMKLNMDLQPVMPKLQQIQQMAQQFSPPPPMDPAVKAQYDIGMAEVQRKRDHDQANIQLQQQVKGQIEPQIEQQRLQLENIRNLRDNIQKTMTALATNQNSVDGQVLSAAINAGNQQIMQQFEQFIAQHEAQLDRDHDYSLATLTAQNQGAGEDGATPVKPAQPPAPPPDPRVDALLQHIQGIHAHLAAPKRVIRDPQGRAIGVHTDAPFMPPIAPPKAPAVNRKPSPHDKKMDAAVQALQALHEHLAAPKQIVRDPTGAIVGVHSVQPLK